MLFYYHHVSAVLNILSDKYASESFFGSHFYTIALVIVAF